MTTPAPAARPIHPAVALVSHEDKIQIIRWEMEEKTA